MRDRCTWRCALVGAIVVSLPIGLWWWMWCGTTTTLLIVRHADRQEGSDALSAAGVTRAEALAHAAQFAGPAAIYHSDTTRTRDTAAALAATVGLTPIVYPAGDAAGVVARIFADHRGQTVVVVGHSNTVPLIVDAAGGPSIPDLDDGEFDRLFVLTVCRCRRGAARLLSLQYGAPSP